MRPTYFTLPYLTYYSVAYKPWSDSLYAEGVNVYTVAIGKSVMVSYENL